MFLAIDQNSIGNFEMYEMKIVDGHLNSKSRGGLGENASYSYWKIDGEKLENISLPNELDAHVDVGKKVRATYYEGKDKVKRIVAIQGEGESVRAVETKPFIYSTILNMSPLVLFVGFVSIFVFHGWWSSTLGNNRTSFAGSPYQLAWIALNFLVLYRYLIKPIRAVVGGVKKFRGYCESKPWVSTSN